MKRMAKRDQASRLRLFVVADEPIKTGAAPGKAPRKVLSRVLVFKGV